MVTFFCSPRPFVNAHTVLIQRNAIESWLALEPVPEVLLMGDESGVAEIARELAVQHIGEIEKDWRGIPMRSSMCRMAREVAKHDLLCIINADIVVVHDLHAAVRRISFPQFVAAGRRRDLDVHSAIRFDCDDWRGELWDRACRQGILRGPSTIDYAVYPKCIAPPILPPFPVNSFGWDPWFLFEHKRRGIPVVDLTPAVTVVHQNHESPAQNRLKRRAWRQDVYAMEALRNAGGFANMMTLREADYQVGASGLRSSRYGGRILSKMATNRVYREILGCKRLAQGWFSR